MSGRQLQCDEYPFWKSNKGGVNISSTRTMAPGTKNLNASEGGYYGQFIAKCLQRNETEKFLLIPMPHAGEPPTTYVCKS